jgi:hypothetical protein
MASPRYTLRSRVVPNAPPKPPPDDKVDRKEYLVLLNSLFPSKYMKKKMTQYAYDTGDDDSDEEYETTDDEAEEESDGYETIEDEEEETGVIREFAKLVNQKPVSERKYLAAMSAEEQTNILEKLRKIDGFSESVVPPRIHVIQSAIPDEYKSIALKKLAAMSTGAHDGEYHKLKMWVDGFMQIPFGKYCALPVTMADGPEKCHEFMAQAKARLDESTYGLNDAKLQIMQWLGQVIANPKASGTSIAIKGPMGTGKTTLVKEGISKILERPFVFISLGGATDSSFLEGHLITYEGSIMGQIVHSLIRCKSMNPIFYFDELDKVSQTPKGDEIIGILTHLTDSSQNDKFHDKFFSEVEFDLSKAIFIFSYNDESKISPILRDRMYNVQTEGYTAAQKAVIAKQYLAKGIRANVAFEEGEVTFTDEATAYIIEHYTQQEKGVRNLKRCIETIFTKLNLFRLMKPGQSLFEGQLPMQITFPFVVTAAVVPFLLKVDQPAAYSHMYC